MQLPRFPCGFLWSLFTAASAIVIFVATSGTVAAASPSAPDWVLVTVTAGPTGARDVTIGLAVSGEHKRAETRAVGFALRDPESLSSSVFKLDGKARKLRTTKAAGSLDLALSEVEGTRFFFSMRISFRDELKPGERLSMLAFSAPADFSEFDHAGAAESGSVELSVRQGSGSQVVFAASPDNEGVAAGTGGATAGASWRAVTSDRGLVGGIASECVACTVSWGGPDGRGGWTVVTEDWADEERLGFAGPAGQWTWLWSGVGDDDPLAEIQDEEVQAETVLAAYAPVGDGWVLFAGDTTSAARTSPNTERSTDTARHPVSPPTTLPLHGATVATGSRAVPPASAGNAPIGDRQGDDSREPGTGGPSSNRGGALGAVPAKNETGLAQQGAAVVALAVVILTAAVVHRARGAARLDADRAGGLR